MKVFKNLEIKKCLHGKIKKECGNDGTVGMLRLLAKLGIMPGSSFID